MTGPLDAVEGRHLRLTVAISSSLIDMRIILPAPLILVGSFQSEAL